MGFRIICWFGFLVGGDLKARSNVDRAVSEGSRGSGVHEALPESSSWVGAGVLSTESGEENH